MKNVLAGDKTTLLLNYAWQPITCISARAAFVHLLKNKVCALDRDGNMYTNLNQWMSSASSLPADQPSLTSSNNEWPVPTVVVVTSKFYRHIKKKKLKLNEMAKIFDYQCQYCLEKYPLSKLTIDHILPRSKGGNDEHSNRTLACFECNSRKSSQYPYYNINNEKVRAPLIPDVIVSEKALRPEWQTFLRKD
jgi:5-methylcytosine-specific restriction endonuclease McrA